MKYSFKDIVTEEMYKSTLVMMIAGQYNIFNNIVADELKDRCKAEDTFDDDDEFLSEFGITVGEKSNKIVVSNTVDFATFMDVVDMPSINGKWFCSTDLTMLNKKQLDKLEKYIKNPSKNGVLVIVSNDFKDFRNYLKNKMFLLGTNSHLIQLGFPNRSVLVTLVTKLFEQRKVKVDIKSAELFVMRMSSAYDDYEQIIDKLCLGYGGSFLSYEQVQAGLKGIENYVLDDFIERLLVPIGSDKIATNRQIYKMLGALLSEMGPMDLVNKVRFKIEDYIEFRMAINSGVIPIKVKFSVVEAKTRLGETSKIAKISDFRFRRMAYTASQTSLKDWTYMKMLLSNTSFKFNVEANEKVLYTLVHRAVLNQSRLNNDLGIENVLSNGIKGINGIKYTEENLMLAKHIERS